MDNITIRPEQPEDYRQSEDVTREAFWDLYQPGCNEHLILHKLRKIPGFVKELDLVACDNDKVVGNIVYSKARVTDELKREFIVLCLGPVAVFPSHQKKGIGSSLIERSLDKARSLGYKAVILFGDPGYYHRFGFRNAKEYGIQTAQGENLAPFMALELREGSLDGIQGKFFYDPVFEPGEDELEMFEKEFSPKEKHITDTQLKK
ncbi:MAG: N-acetyltransferase [Candidatus Paceibacterota bacterium]|jgi:predicted N-acetyltransferase YhbS